MLGPDGHPFGKLTLSISSLRPQALDAVPVGPLRRAAGPRGQARHDQAGGAAASTIRVLHENPREAGLQALLARGDRRVADFIELAAAHGGDWRRALREWDGDPAFYTRRARAAG